MFKLNRFCYCCSLETGGYIIASLCLVCNVVFLFGMAMGIFYLVGDNCHDFGKIADFGVFNFLGFSSNDFMGRIAYCDYEISYMLGVSIAFVVIELIGIFFAIYLIVGTRNRNHYGVLPLMVVFLIDTFMYLLSFFLGKHWIESIGGGLICGYIYLVLYSLYIKLREDRSRHVHPTLVQYRHQPGDKI